MLYTCLFNYMDGTYVSQVRADALDQVPALWLDGLRRQQIHTSHTDGVGMSVLAHFETTVQFEDSFERQVRNEMDPALGPPETLTAMDAAPGVWCACFLITTCDVDHSMECDEDRDEDDVHCHEHCPVFTTSALGELYVIATHVP